MTMTESMIMTHQQHLELVESLLKDSLIALKVPGAEIEDEDVTFNARLIYDSMTTPGRVYHSMQHVFDISNEMTDPILILSALFHDVVYVALDHGFSDLQQFYLDGTLVKDSQQHTLEDKFDNPLVEMVVKLYGFPAGNPLPKLGTNEFLSCIIGVRVLSKWLSVPDLMRIAACIEATIPFRGIEDGKTPMDRLFERLSLVCADQSEEWRVDTVQKAASVANFDLNSFDSKDRDYFLDCSWRLIPEFRPSLLKEDCPLIEYYDEMNCLEGRSKFLKSAVPRIFQRFRQVPSDEKITEMEKQALENLDVMMEYARVRQLQVMVLVEFASVMGEDPQALPMRTILRMDVPQVKSSFLDTLSSVDLEVRNWLVCGRRTNFSWDPAESSLGAYLFDTLGPHGVREAVEIGKAQKPGSHELLKYLPESVVYTVASRLGAVLPDRADRFLQVPEKLGILAQ